MDHTLPTETRTSAALTRALMVSHDFLPSGSVGGFASYIASSFLLLSTNNAAVSSVLFLFFLDFGFFSRFRFFGGPFFSDGSADELDAD